LRPGSNIKPKRFEFTYDDDYVGASVSWLDMARADSDEIALATGERNV